MGNGNDATAMSWFEWGMEMTRKVSDKKINMSAVIF